MTEYSPQISLAPSPTLQTTVLGVKLRNPIIVASGMLTDSLQQITKAVKAGAGAVVTKTIYSGKRGFATEEVCHIPTGTLNSTTYSWRSLEQWLTDLSSLQQMDLPIIVSIHAETPALLEDLAARVSDVCSFPLELGISCPNEVTYSILTPDIVLSYTSSVRRRVSVPISVKLSATETIRTLAEAALEGGADALSLSDTLPALQLERGSPRFLTGGAAGYSGSGIKPIVLHSLYNLRSSGIDCPILGIGGVATLEDVLDYLYLGSSAVQMYTSLVHSGFKRINQLVDQLSDWCSQQQTTVELQIGRALENGRKIDE